MEPRGSEVPERRKGSKGKELRNLGVPEFRRRQRKGTPEPFGVPGKLGGKEKTKLRKELQNLGVPKFRKKEEEKKGTSEPRGSKVKKRKGKKERNFETSGFRSSVKRRRSSKGKELQNLGVLEFRGKKKTKMNKKSWSTLT